MTRTVVFISFGLLFFCLTIAPVLTLHPLSIQVLAADRVLYLALWGWALLLASRLMWREWQRNP